jgi:hypothetical protein
MESRMTASSIDVKCEDYRVTSASIAHTSGGSIFRCTISPVTDQVLARLNAAARANGTVRLIFPKEPLVLERVEVKRIEPESVRIKGQIVSP